MLLPSLVQLGFLFFFTSSFVSTSLSTVWTMNILFSKALGLVVLTWVHIRLVKLALAHNPKEEGYIATHPHVGWELFFPMLWVMILSFLALLGGSFLFVLPGIWLFFSLLFAPILVVDTNKRGFQALQASHDLVKGRFWPVVWRIVITAISFFGILFVLTFCLSLVLSLLFSNSVSQDVSRLTRTLLFEGHLSIDTLRAFSLEQLKGSLLLSIGFPFLVIAQATLYKSMKIR